MIRTALALLLLAGPVAAQDLPDSHPPVMGNVGAKIDTQVITRR